MSEEAYAQAAGREKDTGDKNLFKELAYLVAHDLKAPIANLTTLVDFLDSEKGVTEDGQEVFEKIRDSIKQMQEKLQRLNEVVLLERRIPLETESIRFEERLAAVQKGLETQLKDKEVSLNADFSAAAEVNYASMHLESILQNLLTNAIKFADKDRSPEIRIWTEEAEGYCCLLVQDNGIGIDLDENGDELFVLFKRFNDEIEGNGMGLYLVQSIANSYGGRVEVQSEPGKGATFKVFLRKL